MLPRQTPTTFLDSVDVTQTDTTFLDCLDDGYGTPSPGSPRILVAWIRHSLSSEWVRHSLERESGIRRPGSPRTSWVTFCPVQHSRLDTTGSAASVVQAVQERRGCLGNIHWRGVPHPSSRQSKNVVGVCLGDIHWTRSAASVVQAVQDVVGVWVTFTGEGASVVQAVQERVVSVWVTFTGEGERHPSSRQSKNVVGVCLV